MTKKRILIIGTIVALVVLFFQVFLNNKKPEFDLAQVARGTIYQEISESGQVTMGEKINLAFKNTGRIKKIYAKVGDEVKEGQELAKLETADLEIQLQQAKISLELAQLNLDKLLAGASPEEIKIAQNQVENAKISLNIAQQNLENSYETTLIILNSSYPQIYNALDFTKEFIQRYISVYDEDTRKIINSKDQIESAEETAKFYLETIKKDSSNENIKTALLVMKNSLEITFNNLETMREIINNSVIYQGKVSPSDKTYFDALKININNALNNVINGQQAISSKEKSLEAAKTSLQEAENRLGLITAESRQVDIDLCQAQIKQAQTQVQLYENELEQSKLISPVHGRIIEIKKKVGELVQPTAQDAVIVILPVALYEIKVNIYEEDVVKIKTGNTVEITLVAFPGEKFQGTIVSISPAEKIIEDVVYYEITIGFEEAPEGIKPGMTADLVIQTDLKENVLIIPGDAIQKKEGKTIVKVFKNGLIQEREVEIGLKGVDNMLEIISGLQEGEKVILDRRS